MAVSTPERNASTTPFPNEALAAPWKNRTRKPTEKSVRYQRTRAQPDSSSDELESIQVESNRPARQIKKSATNKDLLATLTEVIQRQSETIASLGREVGEVRQQQQVLIDQNVNLIDEVTELKTRLDQLSAASPGTRSWASVAATEFAGLNASSGTAAFNAQPRYTEVPPIDRLYCTVDVSRARDEGEGPTAGTIRAAIEKDVRTNEKRENWRCRAVTVDQRNQDRIKIACRNEDEHEMVKKAAEQIGAGTRVLRDELYPIRVDTVKRTAVLDENNEIKTGATEAFSMENETTVAKISWLSKKDVPKAYGSMVVYVTKISDARRLVAEGFFHAGGESGTTRTFEHRPRPEHCYNCQAMGHKAYQCKNTQKCARCAKEGHRHRDCREAMPRCVPCGGPHESFSKNCRTLYPLRNE
jgi:predicted nuclease of restriction endonuclease-like (RecB) superfamily